MNTAISPPARKRTLAVLAAAAAAAAFSFAMVQPAAAATSDSSVCADCGELIDTLRADIGSYIPTTRQSSFLAGLDQASLGLFPPDPIQPDAVGAAVILDGLTASTSDLVSAGLVSADGLAAITTDVNSAESPLFTPTDPCSQA